MSAHVREIAGRERDIEGVRGERERERLVYIQHPYKDLSAGRSQASEADPCIHLVYMVCFRFKGEEEEVLFVFNDTTSAQRFRG